MQSDPLQAPTQKEKQTNAIKQHKMNRWQSWQLFPKKMDSLVPKLNLI